MQRIVRGIAFGFTLLLTGLTLFMVLAYLLWPIYSRWGATDREVSMPVPGDDLYPNPSIVSTRAITIQAPAAQVWPWLVQMGGSGRGGLYSYDWLENLFGCNMHSVDRIVPELQNLKLGDEISLHPAAPGMPVLAITPGEALSLGSKEMMVWSFYAEPIDEQTSRLIIRSRYNVPKNAGGFIGTRLFLAPIHFIMEERMMRGIRSRAEALQA